MNERDCQKARKGKYCDYKSICCVVWNEILARFLIVGLFNGQDCVCNDEKDDANDA